MRAVAAVSILGLALALVPACGHGASDLQLARQAAEDADRDRAIGFYQRHLDQHPDDFDARLEYTLLLGEAWAYGGGDRGPILENLERLYRSQPDNLRVRELYAMMLVREGQAAAEARRYAEAEAAYQRALDVHPDVGTASYHLGVLYDEWGKPEAAFEAYVAAAMKRPPIPDLYLRLGRKYLSRGDLDRAISTLGLVQELRGTSTYLLPEMHCSLAIAYARRGERERAREHSRQAAKGCRLDGGA